MSLERLYQLWDAVSVPWLVTMIHFLWQGLLLALLLGTVAWMLRRAAASLRYGMLLGGLALMAACPVVTFCFVYDRARPATRAAALAEVTPTAPLEPATSGSMKAAASPASPFTADLIPPGQADDTPGPHATGAAPVTPEPRVPWWRPLAPLATAFYGAGVMSLLGRVLIGLHGGRKLRRSAQAVTDSALLAVLKRQAAALHLRTVPALAFCAGVAVPTVLGVLRPMILLPFAVAAGLGPQQLEAILAHELAHLRRYDPLVNLVQRLVESFLFFHPAVWWLSGQLRREREHCCDDLVLKMGARPLDYAASLLRVAELSRLGPACPSAVGGVFAVREASSLRQRIARLLGVEPRPPVRLVRAWPLALTVLLVVSLFLAAFMALPSGQGPAQAAADRAGKDAAWGEPSAGLQARIVPVAPDTDEQKPSFATAKRATAVTRPEDLTLLVELKNVSDKAIVLQGTRHGDSVSQPWPGKSSSDSFAPYLFTCEFFTRDGKGIEGSTRTTLSTDAMLHLSGGRAEKLKPGQSLVMLIRPLKWDADVAWQLSAGDFRVRVHYRGPAQDVRKEMQRVWPEKPLATVWMGDVVSAPVDFQIGRKEANKRPPLIWGEPVNGLRAAVEFRSAAAPAQARQDTASATFPIGARLDVHLHIENVSDHAISFWSETWRQDDTVTLIDATGKTKTLGHSWYSGWPMTERLTLKPGQTAVLLAIGVGIAANQEAASQFDHPIGSVIVGKPGTYRLRYELRFDRLERKDKSGKRIIPDEGDWQGVLVTGTTPITVRQRRPEDEPPTFTARLLFQSARGKPVETGQVEVNVQAGWRSLWKGELKPGALAIPGCPFEPLIVQVRAPGFEETRFYDVAVKPNEVTRLTLKRADPARFRLVTRDSKPVPGAKVRFFNRSAVGASAGPYPVDGTSGPIWATSNARGDVVLDMLQKIDPLDQRLGNNIYWFYIEPPDLAPLFVGPVEAGQDLGEIKVGPFLEVRGEVRGTKEELAHFDAEWDQPEPIKGGAGSIWYYAVSKPLETRRDGDKLRFHLTGLHPGKLRIVSRFQRGGKGISHVYSRREPNEADVVFEVELTESRSDLVVTNTKPAPRKKSTVEPGASAGAEMPSMTPVVLSGRVTDETGQPVAQADVFWQAVPWRKQWHGGGERILARAKTQADGSYQLALPQAMTTFESVKGTPTAIWVATRDGRIGWLSTDRPIWDTIWDRDNGVRTTSPLPSLKDLAIRLTTATLPVRVVDPKGQPVSGAAVTLIYRTQPGRTPANLVRTTDTQGRLDVALAADPAALDSIWIDAPRFGTQYWRRPQEVLAARQADGVVPLKLKPVTRLSGKITTPSRAAVLQGGVHADVWGHSGNINEEPRGFAWIVPDDDGTYQIPALVAGLLKIEHEFWYATYESERSLWPYYLRAPVRSQKNAIELKAGRPQTVNFSVETGVLVRGRLRNRANQPENIGIIVRHGVRDQWDRATERIFVGADAQGRFEVHVLAGWIALERNVLGSDRQHDGDVPKTSRYVPPGTAFDLGVVNLPEAPAGPGTR